MEVLIQQNRVAEQSVALKAALLQRQSEVAVENVQNRP
jgi:hypothetical protein